MKLFAGSSNPELAAKLAKELGVTLGSVELSTFPNGERRVWVHENVRRENVVLIQSFSQPVDTHIMEFALMVDALRRAGARKIISVIPWLGYSLQDKMFRLGEPIAAKVIADFISREVRRHILVNLHSDSIAGFFPVPASQVSAMEMFAQYAKKKGIDNAVVVSPDFGAIKRARAFAQMLDVPLMHINKERDRVTGEITVHGMSDTPEGKTCLVIDDVVSTGGTLVETAQILKKSKAAAVRFFSTHAQLVGDAHVKLAASPLDELVVSDTVSIPVEKRFKNLSILSIAPILAPEIKVWV